MSQAKLSTKRHAGHLSTGAGRGEEREYEEATVRARLNLPVLVTSFASKLAAASASLSGA